MFLKRFLSDAGERPRHPPRSRSPSPVRVKRIEMKDMPDTSLSDVDSTLDDVYAAFQSGPTAGPGPGPDPDHLRDRLSRVATDINFQPALPMPEEGVVGFDELRERNERKLKMGYDSTGLPIARLSSIGMPSPPASRPVSQNMHLSSSMPGYYNQQQQIPGAFNGAASESEDGSSDLSVHTSATSMASERLGKTAAAAGHVSRRRTVHRMTAGGTRRPGTYAAVAMRRSRSAGAASVASSSKTPQQQQQKRRVLTIQVRHPSSPGKSRLSEVYSPTEPTHTPVSRAVSRRVAARAPPVATITEEELSELHHQKEQSDAALTASLNELAAVRRELALLKKRHRQEQRALARERDFVGEDLDETRDELAMLREDFADMELAAQQDQVTATQLRRRLHKQKAAFAELQQQMAEREAAVQGLEVDAAEKERMLADIAAANEQLEQLQADLRAKSVELEVAQDDDHSDSLKAMQVSALTHMVASLQLQIEALKAANHAADRSNTNLKLDLADEKTVGAAHADAVAALQTETREKADRISDLETETQEQAAKIAELEAAAAAAAETAAADLTAATHARETLETELAAVASELRISKSEVAALAAAGSANSGAGPDFAARVIELTAVLETQRIAVEQLHADLASAGKQAALQQAALAADLDDARTQLAASNAEKKRVEAKLSSVATEAEELAAKAATLDEARAQAHVQVAQLTDDKTALEAKLQSITDRAKQLRTRLADNYADAATDFSVLAHANETLEAQLADAHAHVAQLEYQCVNASAHMQSLQAELAAMTAHAALLESEEVQYKVQIESLSDRLAKDRSRRSGGGPSSTAGGSSSGRHGHHHHHHHHGGSSSSTSGKKATLAAGRHEELVIVRSSNRDKGSM